MRRLIALPLAALTSVFLTSVAVAGGWAQVTVDNPPVDPPAGGPGTPVELSVLQHGVSPVSWPNLTVIATDARSGAVVRTAAEAKGPAGSYLATIVFPNAGQWTLTFESPELQMAGSVAVSVAPAVGAAPPVRATQPAASAPANPAVDVMPLAVMLFCGVLVLAVVGLAVRGRASSAETGVPART
jgi:hypothetical protein